MSQPAKTVLVFGDVSKKDIAFLDERARLLGPETKAGPLSRRLVEVIIDARRADGRTREGVVFSEQVLNGELANLLKVGSTMETTLGLTQAATEQAKAARKELETTANQVTELVGVVHPKMLEAIRQLRDSRMAMVREVHESLSALKDIRQFFLEDRHAEQISRLREFVAVCQALAQLKDSGVLDAVVDTVIRLSVQENGQ